MSGIASVVSLRTAGQFSGLLALLLFAYSPAQAQKRAPTFKYDPDLIPGKESFASRYRRPESPQTLVRNARVLTGTDDDLERTDILIRNGVIVRMGAALKASAGTVEIDATDKWVTPGLLDLGFGFESPTASADESSVFWILPNLHRHRAEQIRALSGGVTTVLYNLFSAEHLSLGVVLRNRPDIDHLATLMPGAPLVLSITCPSDFIGWDALERELTLAAAYRSGKGQAFSRRLNVIAGAMAGDITLHIRCGSADAIALILALAGRKKLKIGALVEAAEGYKLARRLVEQSICTAFPLGARESHRIRGEVNAFAAALLDAVSRQDSCAIVQSGGAEDIGQLNLLAGRARAHGTALNLQIPSARAISWITANPAKALRIEDKVGRLAVGRAADLVVWSGDPFSSYSRAEKVFLDGVLAWDLARGGRQQLLDEDVRAQATPVSEAPAQRALSDEEALR